MEIRYHRFNGIIKTRAVFVLFLLCVFLVFFLVAPAMAQDRPNDGESYEDFINRVGPTGLGNAFSTNSGSPLNAVAIQGGGFDTSVTFESIVSTVITMALGFMGVIFLVLAIYGGFKWMTAAGNEDSVEKAKKTITNAVIGMIVVLSAYAAVRLVVDVVGKIVFK